MHDITMLQQAYGWMNSELFDNRLPHVWLVTHRHAGSYGYAARNRFRNKEDNENLVHELALNPDYFYRSTREVLATLLHEMCHIEQYCYGTPSRGGYHNKEWGEMMIRVGLMPCAHDCWGAVDEDGKLIEGMKWKATGQAVGHVIIKGGPADQVISDIETIIGRINFTDAWVNPVISGDGDGDEGQTGAKPPKTRRAEPKSRKNKVKYTCPCGNNVWGKPGLHIACFECQADFVSEEEEEEEAEA